MLNSRVLYHWGRATTTIYRASTKSDSSFSLIGTDAGYSLADVSWLSHLFWLVSLVLIVCSQPCTPIGSINVGSRVVRRHRDDALIRMNSTALFSIRSNRQENGSINHSHTFSSLIGRIREWNPTSVDDASVMSKADFSPTRSLGSSMNVTSVKKEFSRWRLFILLSFRK